MKTRAFPYLIGLMALPLAVGLACGSPAPAPTAAPTQAPRHEAAAPTPPAASSRPSPTRRKYLAIDVPGDWDYTQTVDTDNNYWYWDVFTSPDGHARIESIVYDDGKPFVGTQSGKTALHGCTRTTAAPAKKAISASATTACRRTAANA